MRKKWDKKTRHLFPEQMLHGQMSPEQLCLVKDGHGKLTCNLTLKFGQNWMSNSWDIADNLGWVW